MGAGQIGGIATLLDIDFDNAAGFVGEPADAMESQYIVYYLSHAMMFCVGALLEAHVVLTPASCIYGEKYKFEVFGGTHYFLENAGTRRIVDHVGIHRAFNISMRWEECTPDNIALMVLGKEFSFNQRYPGSDYIMNRIRYSLVGTQPPDSMYMDCRFYGWGSRRNGYLVPLLIRLQRVHVQILPSENCLQMWNFGEKYLCVQQFPCKSSKHGALCPDDLGSVLECSGFLRGMMVSRIIDRPCGVGFLDMTKYTKFITCGVDDSRDILTHDDFKEFEVTIDSAPIPEVEKVELPQSESATQGSGWNCTDDPGPPKEAFDEDDPYADTPSYPYPTSGSPSPPKKPDNTI